MQPTSVRQGQRYAQRLEVRERAAIWEVGSIKNGTVPVPHARLINIEDPLHTKTISCVALANPTYYELIADPAPGPA
jgi:hypothetical protein